MVAAETATAEKFASFIVNTTFEDLPRDAIDIAKHAMLDCLGVILAGAEEEVGEKIRNLVRKLGGEPRARVIASDIRTSAPLAALANGTMGHALDYDDAGAFGHPSITTLPTILALADEVPISGREAIAAYVLAFDVGARLRDVIGIVQESGWHPTGVVGTVVSAAVAAKLLNLDLEQTTMALGIATSQAAGVGSNIGSMTKPFHAGNANNCGIIAALLAKDGFTASRDSIEGSIGFAKAFSGGNQYDIQDLTINLGNPFKVIDPSVSVKLYPSCYATQGAIETTIDLVKEHHVSPDQIESVNYLARPRYATVLLYPEPKTGIEGKFSLQFSLATAILERKAGLGQFTDEKVNDPVTKELMKRVTLRAYSDWDEKRDYGKRPNILTIRLKDGTEHRIEVLKVAGKADVPLVWSDQLADKYRDCSMRVLKSADIERSMELMLGLEELKSVSEVTDVVTYG